MTFELTQAIVDVIWSPFESCVFFAQSLDNTHVFDLRKNRHEAIQESAPSNIKCTNLAMNGFEPILLVGDSQGGIFTYKISDLVVNPNVDLNDD